MVKYIVTWKRSKTWAKNMGYPINGRQDFTNKKFAERWANRKRKSPLAHSVKIKRKK